MPGRRLRESEEARGQCRDADGLFLLGLLLGRLFELGGDELQPRDDLDQLAGDALKFAHGPTRTL